MKKILLLPLLVFSLTLTAQIQRNYLAIGYSSICCGTPSSKLVLDALEKFRKKNKLSTFEVLKSGCGEEGEYNLCIGIDKLNPEQKKELQTALVSEIEQQNKMRNESRDGYVEMQDKITTRKMIKKERRICEQIKEARKN